MSVYAYPTAAALADGGRAGLGIAIAGAPLLFGHPAPVVTALLAVLLLAFAGLGGAALRRHLGHVEIDTAALAVNGRRLSWSAVRAVRLAYFSTRRDREKGWFQLTVAGDDRRLTIDSALDGFRAIAARAALVAEHNGLSLDDATRANFAALAVALPPG